MLQLTINGIAGRMGRELSLAIENSSKFELLGGIDLNNTYHFEKILVTTNPDELLPKTDVVVDFSLPEGAEMILKACLIHQKPLVTGTTGLDSKLLKDFENASKIIPIVQSFNFSIGINLLIQLVQKSAEILHENFDIEIVEKHHRNKLDSPSGTAMILAQTIALASQRSFPETIQYGRKGTNLKREKEIGMHSLRGGSVIGDHELFFLGQNENLILSHQALNRKIFVDGALTAAEWILKKKNGLYGMKEVLGF